MFQTNKQILNDVEQSKSLIYEGASADLNKHLEKSTKNQQARLSVDDNLQTETLIKFKETVCKTQDQVLSAIKESASNFENKSDQNFQSLDSTISNLIEENLRNYLKTFHQTETNNQEKSNDEIAFLNFEYLDIFCNRDNASKLFLDVMRQKEIKYKIK